MIRHLSQSGQSTADAQRHQGRARQLDRDARWRRPERSGRYPEVARDARRIAATRSNCLPAGASIARTPAASASPRSFANALRSRLLRDETPDTGCGIKLFERAAFLDLPYFDHMHRYLPALMQRAGWQVQERAGQPSRAWRRRFQIQQLQSRDGRHFRPARRGLADPSFKAHGERGNLRSGAHRSLPQAPDRL